jgi:hypothetical protein
MISVFIRQGNGELTECQSDADTLAKCRTLRLQGATGRELIGQVMAVDPNAPPLSVRLAGVDDSGKAFEEFFCYS